MKSLCLVRHAKSSRDDPTLADRDRPLDDRGRRDARRMGERLDKRGTKPDLMISSPARRALDTAELIAGKLDYRAGNIMVDESLYAATPDQVLALIRALDDKVKCVMLVGHNPAFAELAGRLSDAIAGMPTCAVAEFAFDTRKWSDVGALAPTKATLRLPREP